MAFTWQPASRPSACHGKQAGKRVSAPVGPLLLWKTGMTSFHPVHGKAEILLGEVRPPDQ